MNENVQKLAKQMAEAILSTLDAKNHPASVLIEPYIRVEINNLLLDEKISKVKNSKHE